MLRVRSAGSFSHDKFQENLDNDCQRAKRINTEFENQKKSVKISEGYLKRFIDSMI